MATLDENITRLKKGKERLKAALRSQGYTDTSEQEGITLADAKISELAPFVAAIEQGTAITKEKIDEICV